MTEISFTASGPGFEASGSVTITQVQAAPPPTPPEPAPPEPAPAPAPVPSPAPPAPPPRFGSTVSGNAYSDVPRGDWLAQALRFDQLIGYRAAQVAQKRYLPDGRFPVPSGKAYTAIPGCHYAISVKPGWPQPSGPPVLAAKDLDGLKWFIAGLQAAGVSFEIIPWQEGNLAESPFDTPDAFTGWFRQVAAVAHAAGAGVIYNPGGSALDTALSWYPGDDAVDAVLIDYYIGTFGRRHVTLDKFAPLAWARADGRQVPFGLGEYGLGQADLGLADWTRFTTHISGFLGAAPAGPVWGAMYFEGPGPVRAATPGHPGHGPGYDPILSPDDFKIAGVRQVAAALGAVPLAA